MDIKKISILDVVKSYGIEVKKAGKDAYKALCPFHNDTHPSLTLYSLKNTFKCFSCGRGGNVAQFVIEKENCSFPEAVEKLKRLKGTNPSEQTSINRKPDRIHAYHNEKGLPIYRKLIFKDKTARIERLEDNKWLSGLNGTSHTPYNLPILKESSVVCISESEKDVDFLTKLNIRCVSSGGANNWHEEWKNLFIDKDVVILPHNDEAGKKFADVVTESLAEAAKTIKIVAPITFGEKSGNDVADFIEERLQQKKNNEQIKSELLEIIKNTPVHKPVRLLDKLQKSTDILNLDCKVEWVVEKIIPEKAITLLFGRGGIGKTWLALQMGKAVAEGADFLNLETKKATTIYIDFENPIAMLKERLEILGTSPDFYIWHLSNKTSPPKLDRKEWDLYKRLPKDSILIFDTLRASQGGDENSSQDMAIVMERLKMLREAGHTIILLHHTPKGNEAIYKGSTAILDLVDHALCLEKIKDEEDLSLDTGIFRLGTKEKTRFELCEVHISFDIKKGFGITLDPQEEKCLELSELMQEMEEDGKDLIQKNILEKVKENLEWSKNKILKLLKKGEDNYWNSTRQGKERFYTLINNSSIPPLYIDRKRGIDKPLEEIEAGIDREEKSLQLIDNKVSSSIPDTPLETRKGEDIKVGN